MNRDEIRQMAVFINTQRPAWMHIDVPDPEPEYWDNFPHLLPEDITRYTHGSWALILTGTYTPEPCDACGTLAWEYDWVNQGEFRDVDRVLYYFDTLHFCLPCLKAANEMPRVILDDSDIGYASHFPWNMRDIVASQDVITPEFWRQKSREYREYVNRRFPPKEA